MSASQLGANTVIEGEASESEEEEEEMVTTDMDPHAQLVAQQVVKGEASESDEDDDGDGGKSSQSGIPPLKVDTEAEGDEIGKDDGTNGGEGESRDARDEAPAKDTNKPAPEITIKYDTLLHKKLRERNASFHGNLQEYMKQKYLTAGHNIREITRSLGKSQVAIQDVSHNLRLLTNDLFHLEDKIDIVTSCAILPDIKLHD